VKRLHREDLWGWSTFDEARNIDFHGVLWARVDGNIAFDPLPLSEHDAAHVESLGGVATIVITNSDHVRAADAMRKRWRAEVLGPSAERDQFPLTCDGWLADGDEVVPGLIALELAGSKTPGELALLLDGSTLITGDLVRAHEGGKLCMLPDGKLRDRDAAVASVHRLAELDDLDAVLVGDGWPIFRDGSRALRLLASSLPRGPS
jgi:glyoxylase-like metal-dependent hydrolase (beta-lactamase superfamily II)